MYVPFSLSSFWSKCTTLTVAPQIFCPFLFLLQKNPWLTKGSSVVTPLTALSSNLLSRSRLLAVTLQSIHFECQNKTKQFPQMRKLESYSFSQPMDTGFSSFSTFHPTHHTYTHFLLSYTSFQLRYTVNFLLFKKLTVCFKQFPKHIWKPRI